jgi:hypothetical protein
MLWRDKMDLWIAGLLGLSSRKTIDVEFLKKIRTGVSDLSHMVIFA